MKKLISIILVLSFIFCFSACRKEDASSEISSEPVVDTVSSEVSSVETVVSSQASSSSNTVSSKNNNSSAASSEEITVIKEVFPEKVLEVYSFENQFRMPESESNTFYDSVNGKVLPYRLFKPHDYNPSNKYPVILFLHGAGEIGTDNQDQLTNISKMFTRNGDLVASAFLICPQTNEWWEFDMPGRGGTLSSALRLLEQVEQTYSCDSNRIYVTGLSMGGYATWDLLENYGDKFAAGIPVCGVGNSSKGSVLADIPIRIYHGTADPTINISFSRDMYNAIIAAGGQKVKLYELEGVNHNSWDTAYSDRDTFSWMLAQNKATNPTCEYKMLPFLKITDSSGATVISDEDIIALSYMNDYEVSGIRSVDFILSSTAKDRLNRAYKMSGGSPFTFWCGTQKIYTFTATDSLPDNVFSVRDIFNKINYGSFYDTIENIVYG